MSLKFLSVCLGAVFLLVACRADTLSTSQPGATPTELAASTELSTQPATAIPGTPTTQATLTQTATQVAPATATPTSPPQPESPAAAGVLPDPAGYQWAPVLSGLSRPVFVGGAGDGSGRLFIISQSGQIFIARDGQLLAQPFLDISDRTFQPGSGGSYGERGLLGLAFDPDFAHNGLFYVNYTDASGDTHIARFSVRSDDPDLADPNSEVQLIFVKQPFPNHNGGGMAFGPDGYLYLSLGDGGSAGDPFGNGQSLQTMLGKILRLDVSQGEPYAIPPDNSFAGGGGLPEIWAYGLRNAWRLAFDRLTGDLYIADVGQNSYEEVNFQAAGSPGGLNYGWNFREGLHEYKGTPPADLSLVDPVAEYSHQQGCSITGGAVYRGANLPEWQGVYLYGDYCSGRIWGLLRSPDGTWQNQELFQSGFTITSFGEDDGGEIYVLDYGGGVLYRLEGKP